MKKFERAYVPQSEKVRVATDYALKFQQGNKVLRDTVAKHQKETGEVFKDDNDIVEFFLGLNNDNAEIWKNDVYQVALYREVGPGVHLSIKRIDRGVIHDWRDLQEIKNQLVGRECEGVELYPAESRRVDTANQFRIWCIGDENFRFPLGFTEGLMGDDSAGGSVNRPFAEKQ